MPILKGRYAYTKVYRPSGTRWVEARGHRNQYGTPTTVGQTVILAMKAFIDEHGYQPSQDETIIEVIGVTGGWVVQMFHITDMSRERSNKEIR